MIRPISNVRRHARTLMAIVLLGGWPAVAGAGAIGDTALVLHTDAYWYNNENHSPGSVQAPTPSVVETTPETWDTTMVLHPDAYSYDNEGHASSWGQTTTAPGGVQVRGQATETWDTTMVLHPDAYWYNGENHAPRAPEASTPSVQLASPAR
jgi:hypothetical protein